MKFRTLIRRSLSFHWRSHLGVVLGAAIGSAALIGALVVGDSVKESLRERALERLGDVDFAFPLNDRTMSWGLVKSLSKGRTTNLISRVGQPSPVRPFVGLMMMRATAANEDQSSRANSITLYGVYSDAIIENSRRVGDEFWNYAPQGPSQPSIASGEIWLNEALARQLHATNGDTLILRIAKRAGLSSEIAISSRNNSTGVIRKKVGAILSTPQLGDFNPLQSGGITPLNAFINLYELQTSLGLSDRINLVVAPELQRLDAPPDKSRHPIIGKLPEIIRNIATKLRLINQGTAQRSALTISNAITTYNQDLRANFHLTDAECSLKIIGTNDVQLGSSRVFLDKPVAHAALSVDTNKQPILTYLATLLQSGTNATPYSMVTAAGAPWTPADLRDDEIVVSQWLAEDLHVKPGDPIALSYFLPESGAKLTEATNTFRVRSIAPAEMPWADRTLMPDFPGIENAESTSEWDAGFPLTYKIRPQDEDYWKKFRGTPKAFITLAAGQKMWGNRFGNLTAIRFPVNASNIDLSKNTLEKKILAHLKPEDLGMRFEPVREQALKAAEESQDFGGLFLGFSFFLIIAALLLMAMLFQFGLEQRAPEIGTLLALGFTVKQVRKLLLREGIALAFIGGIIGTVGGIYFAKTMLHALTTIWKDAVGATALSFHYTSQTLVIGLLSSVIVSAVTIWLALRKFVKRPARELLAGDVTTTESRIMSVRYKVLAIVSLLAAIGLVGWALAKHETANAEIFFSAGSLILIAGLGSVSAWLARKTNTASVTGSGAQPSLGALALRGCARRRKRSLATVAMLACGSFLIVSIGVFRLDANVDATKKASGTGGFALLGEMTMPIVHDLNSASGRDFFALNENDLKNIHFVPFRVRAGDEASCLNLNAAQKPRLLGVSPAALTNRFSFAKGKEWQLLARPHPNPLPRGEGDSSAGSTINGDDARPGLKAENQPSVNEIPAIGDANSIQWAMHKKVGDTIDYVDERGQPFKVRIVGAVANSILQGQLIIDEAEFVKRFPGESGYRMFLIDAPSNAVTQVSAALSRALQDVGLELTPTVQRLAQFNAVQNTYLGTFQVLGGLGLLLGSVGLGIVVLRNVLERRGELALMIALGFRKATLQSLLLMENGALLLAGLATGVVAAAVAVLPAVLSPSAQLPYGSLSLTLAAVLVNGALWTWAATKLAVRGDLLKALRNE